MIEIGDRVKVQCFNFYLDPKLAPVYRQCDGKEGTVREMENIEYQKSKIQIAWVWMDVTIPVLRDNEIYSQNILLPVPIKWLTKIDEIPNN